ncbi:hypothetical protein Sta7437_1258 [Stanieria cyanosphaera PCC 7437]|uniref:Nucleotide-binding protein n=1 Tax=Stanieria cyanosphaera (strain ATCC 29371 / PCC 7437) TaxID=111780 RepID=K9XQN0_STAC7|nr:hypothetical protein [Stanieria cyanosphaera]AFZ34828.1 hypothetical protein Sta7437_1258 [Stanieria cyanosphaera PCC 7437]
MRKTEPKLLTDLYNESLSKGKVIGSNNSDGIIRQGIDAEKLITIDHGALRFSPLVKAGWGREGIAYGPYIRANGLACAFVVLNGHNTSQSGDYAESIFRRLKQWAEGSHHQNPIQRFWGWLRSYKRESLRERIYRWILSSKKYVDIPTINENLAVGWFSQAIPSNPLAEGNGFIVHATGTENGELWARVANQPLRVLRGLQNIPIYYVVILREQGAAYYAASLPNAHGLAAYPNLRPLAIDPFNQDQTVYAAVYQSVLGQIGFSVDTRIYGAKVQQISELNNWYGTACVADSLKGNGLLDNSPAEIGGVWQVKTGSYERTANGVKAKGFDNWAILNSESEIGLIHVMILTSDDIAVEGIVWRIQNQQNYWRLLLSDRKCQVCLVEEGTEIEIATSLDLGLKTNSLNSVQILDDGETIGIYINGQLWLNQWFTDTRLQNATGVGIYTVQNDVEQYWQALEAHPRQIPFPAALDLGSPWQAQGQEIVVTEQFTGTEEVDLAKTTTTTGEKIWRKDIGRGIFSLTGNNAAKVQANPQNPNPGRTAYTIAWDNLDFADLQVDITPPGTQRKQREKGRGGLIFWQDRDNYIIINNWLDDCYGGAAICSFFFLNGFEDVYDAVWTNVGSRVYWGVKHTFRVVFDGINYTVFVNQEPVLYRALTDVYPKSKRLKINRVGIVANWDWGNDTGSVFENFVARK